MREIKVIQGSEEWQALRLGKLTASKFPKLMPTKRQKVDQWNTTQLGVLRETAAERLTRLREETFTNGAMQWGIDHEEDARGALSSTIGMPIRESGFWEMNDYVGGSPDGIIGFNEYLCELKCPTSKQHLRYWLDMNEWLEDYGDQIKAQMWITGIHEGYYASWDPRYKDNDRKLAYSSIALTDEDIDRFDNRIGLAVDLIKEWTA